MGSLGRRSHPEVNLWSRSDWLINEEAGDPTQKETLGGGRDETGEGKTILTLTSN